jgi:Tol biopolymer transport system component
VQQVRTVNLTKITFDPGKQATVGQPVQITQGLKDTMTPKLSPDGQQIVFYTVGKQESLYVIDSDGTRLRQLTEDEYRYRGPRWSPDGKYIGVFSNRSGRDEIWMMRPDGTALRQLTDFGCRYGPRWSPDGTHFACAMFFERIPVIVEVGRPSKNTALAQFPGDDRFRVNGWSPDGRTLAGSMDAPAGSTGIVLYSLDSREYQRITTFGWNPVWLSDSRRLLFQYEGKIYLVDARSRKVREVLSVAPHEVEDNFGLSNDDRLILFGLVVTEADIWMMEEQ